MKLRKGLLREVADIFDAADEMCGSLRPEHIDDERERISRLRKETMSALRSYNRETK